MDLLEEVFDANNFKINEESIGEGKYGKVHIAVRSDSIKFAVKIIPHSSNDPDIEKNVLRESSILRSIQHPSILKFIGLTITTNETKIFTELLPNGSLKDKLYGHDDDFTTTKKYIALIGISDAMRYLYVS